MSSELLKKMDSIALFRGVCEAEPLKSFRNFLKQWDSGEEIDVLILSFSEFVNKLYSLRSDADLSGAIWDVLINDENPFLRHKIDSIISPDDVTPMSTLLSITAERELEVLSDIGRTTSIDIKEGLYYTGYLPDFRSSNIDMKMRYMDVIDNLGKRGYGVYAKHIMFKAERGELIPVKHPDPICIEDLFCYDMQREKVIRNTRAFIEGKSAADCLLYGDAGTGKSSTVKACARMYADQGIRLVELPKSEIDNLSSVIENLSQIPMKFILFIDDISFESSDDRIGSLKSVLEGAASGGRRNIIIYATSNRRHMIKESFSDRKDEVHASDTIAEQMSLSERFGLRVLFDKPDKKTYLEIVRKLCEHRGIEADRDKLEADAERIALRGGGRSARLARQFVDSLEL